jgi:hypothetical protein
MELISEVVSYLNANQPMVIALGGLLSVVAQYGINHIKCLSKFANYLLGLGVLPILSTVVLSLATTVDPSVYPWVALAGQTIYALYEWLKRHAVKQATPAVVNGELQGV